MLACTIFYLFVKRVENDIRDGSSKCHTKLPVLTQPFCNIHIRVCKCIVYDYTSRLNFIKYFAFCIRISNYNIMKLVYNTSQVFIKLLRKTITKKKSLKNWLSHGNSWQVTACIKHNLNVNNVVCWSVKIVVVKCEDKFRSEKRVWFSLSR